MSGSRPTPPLSTIFPVAPAINPAAHDTLYHAALCSSRGLLIYWLFPGGHFGTQPQRDVLRLHRLPDHRDQILAHGGEVCFVAQPGAERDQGRRRVVLPAVEASIYGDLYAASEGTEQGGNCQSGDYDDELLLFLVSGEGAEGVLQGGYAPEVHQREHHGQRAVDEGTVDDHVYVVEAVAEDGDAQRERHDGQGDPPAG